MVVACVEGRECFVSTSLIIQLSTDYDPAGNQKLSLEYLTLG